MKTTRKLFSMVLSLSLVLTLFCGAPAAAEDNLIGGWGGTVTGTTATAEDGILTIPLAGSQGLESRPEVAVTPGQAYQISFTYKLSEAAAEKGSFKVCGINETVTKNTPLIDEVRLPATGEAYKSYIVGFTPTEVADGDPMTKVRITFAGYPISDDSAEVFSVKDVVLTTLSDEKLLANGSAELLDEAGRPVGITGGTLVQEGAKDGQNMMQVSSGETMHMQLALAETAKIAKIRGFIKPKEFTAGSSVTVSIKADGIDGTELASKTFTAKPEESETDSYLYVENDVWEYIRFSAVSIKAALVVSVSVTGAGSVYVDGVTIEKDENLVQNPACNTASSYVWRATPDTWKNSEGNAITDLIQTDAECPDGSNYLLIYPQTTDTMPSSGIVGAYVSDWLNLEAGAKYKVSFWIKSDTTARVTFECTTATGQTAADVAANYTNALGTAASSAQAGNFLMVCPSKTDGVWKQFTYTVTIPQNHTRCRIQLRHQGGAGKYVAYCMPVVEKIEENETLFFKNTTAAYGALEWYSLPFVNVLGEEAEPGVAYTEGVKAVHVTTAPETISTDRVILAAFKNSGNGVRQLVGITVGDVAVRPAAHSGYNPDGTGDQPKRLLKTVDGTALYGVNYPTANLTGTDMTEADEIRAYVWDSVSGMRPADEYAVFTK